MQNQKISFHATTAIPRYGCVTSLGGLADSSNPLHENKIIGVTEGEVANTAWGDATLVGLLFNKDWTWTPGARIYLNGTVLSETAPVLGFVQQMGWALTLQSVQINVQSSGTGGPGPVGPAGPAGAAGPVGPVGPAGAPGTSGLTLTLCDAFTPTGTGADTGELLVPFDPADGTTPITFTLRRVTLRVQTAGGTPAVDIEKSLGAGVFSAVLLTSIAMPGGASEVSASGSLGNVASGDKVRFNVTTLGTAQNWTVQLDLGT